MKTPLNLIMIAALVPVWLPAFAAAELPASGDRPLTILVHDYVGLPDSDVHDLQTFSVVLLSRSGIRAEWIWCNAGRRDARSTMCGDYLEPGRVLFRIQDHYPEKLQRTGDVLGNAEIAGSFASLYVSDIRQHADHNDLSFGCLMAYAAVHEIGHLLLGKEHSRSGMMRARWGKDEYRAMAKRWMAFSDAESETMRRALPAPDQRLAGMK